MKMLNDHQNKTKVSIIIPVFNDEERLEICLERLEHQTYPRQLYEVIVVDNGSEQDIESLVKKFSQANYTYELKPGSYAARNQGVLVAKGDIFGFTDSDCIPNLDWIEQGVEQLTSTLNCGLVAGRIDLFVQNKEKPTPVELFEKIELNFLQAEKLAKDHFGMTANIFTFKHVIENIGNFDSTLKSGGDREWGQRVYAAGYQQVYADNACVAHPARKSFSQLRKRIARLVGGSFDRMMSENPSLTEILIDLLAAFKPPFRSIYRAWQNEDLCGFQQKIQFIVVMFFARYILITEKIRLYLGADPHRG